MDSDSDDSVHSYNSVEDDECNIHKELKEVLTNMLEKKFNHKKLEITYWGLFNLTDIYIDHRIPNVVVDGYTMSMTRETEYDILIDIDGNGIEKRLWLRTSYGYGGYEEVFTSHLDQFLFSV